MIGTRAYASFGDLDHSTADARAFAKQLQSRNVQVFCAFDRNIYECKAIMELFLAALQPGDLAIVFFAGHAVEFHGTNLLIVKSVFEEENFETDAIDAKRLMDRLAIPMR